MTEEQVKAVQEGIKYNAKDRLGIKRAYICVVENNWEYSTLRR